MSFLSRTPLEEFFGKLSSDQVAPLLQDSLSKIEGPFMQNLVSNFSYHLTDEAKQWLTKEGVSLCPNVHQVHSHPCSKTVENHILYNILPGIIESYTDLTLLSIKTNKFDRIKRMNKKAHLNVLNRVVTSRDSYRYGPRTPISRMGLHKNLHLFIHDEIHYWGMAQLEDFLNFYEPQTLLATLVYPVELMFDVNFSLLPFCYTFEKEGDHFAYFPDGHRSSAYRQRLDSGELLKVNKIKTLKYDYAVDMLHSIGSHHIFQIRRVCDSEILEAKRYFGTYPYLDVGPLFGRTRVPVQGINSNTLKKVIIYLFSLKKPDPQSAVAKLRQLMNDQIDLQSMWVVRDLCARIQQFNTSWSNVNILTLAKDWIGDLAKNTGLGSLELAKDFQRELMRLSDVKFEIKLNAENTGARLDMDSIEEVWMGTTSEIKYQDRDRVYLERERAPYYGLAPWVDFKEEICIPQAIALMDRIKAKLKPAEIENLGFGGYLEYPIEKELKGKELAQDIPTDEETGSNSSASEPEGSIQSSERRGPDSLILTGECSTSYAPDFSNSDKVGRREALFFSKDGYSYCYNGGSHKSRGWPEQFNHGIFKPYNSCLVQRYKNNDSIPFHRDDENCYDLNHCPVLTVNLYGKAIFEVEGPDREIQKFLLDENSFLLMPPEFQRDHRHRVTSLTDGRVSLTFRIQRRDCIPRGISYDTLLDLAAPYDCFFEALSRGFTEAKKDIMGLDIQTLREVVENKGLNLAKALAFAKANGYPISIEHNGLEHKSHEQVQAHLRLLDGHYSLKGKKTTLDSRAQEKLNKVMHGSEKVRVSLIEAIHPVSTSVAFKVDKRAAESLFKSLMEGTTGIRSHQVRYDGMKMLHGAKDMSQAITKINGLKEAVYEVYTILGFAGSGKSHRLQEWLVTNQVKGENLLISPRKNLLSDWKEKVRDLEGCTFETALKKDMRPLSLIVLDELSLFPHGYLDLLICKLRLSGIEPAIVALGDPLQAKYHSDLDKNKLAKVHEIERLGEVRYLDYTHRLPIKIANKLSVDTTSTETGIIGKVYADLPSARVDLEFQPEVILTASRAEKDLYEFNTMTFGESQGLTFDYGLIALAEETKLTSDNALLVALTRFRKGYAYIYNGRTDFDRYKRTARGLLKRVLEDGPVSKMYMAALTQNKLKPIKLDAAGAGLSYDYREGKPDEVDREEKIQGDPWLKGQIYLGQRVNIASPEEAYIETAKEEMGIHLPISTEKFITIHMDKLKEKYRREILSVRGASDQIRESARTNDRTELNQAWKVESIYLNHTSRDDTTFWAAVKKRLRFSNPETNARKFMAATTSGKVMLKEFLKHVPIKPVLDRALLEEATLEFEEKKLSKPVNILEKHSYRSDPDERADMVSIFLKTQLCTKFEKRFVDAKAGQTIACFHHNVLVRFAPLCRYVEKLFTAFLPEHYYIHQKKNFDELERFVQDHYQGGICVESDYEAFDASQDANVLSFEVELMKHMQLPSQYIEDYKLMKFCLGSKLGNLAIMRFTGEFCTFLFNTFSNMAFTFLRYDIPQKAPILFAGDDMCSLVPLRPTMANWATLERLSLKAKVNFVEKPLFCGWRLTRYGLYKEPALVYERMLISSEKGTIHDTINSYFLEFMYAYKKGGLLEGLMDEEQMDFHHRCVRYILRYQHHLHKENLSLVREWVEEP